MTATSWQEMSDGELQATLEAGAAEAARRGAEGEAKARARFRQELTEVRDGVRLPYREHIDALSPHEVAELARRPGALEHLGIGAKRR